MSDTDKLYAWLLERGPVGVHTAEIRSRRISGNPSQRATDIERKYGVTVDRRKEKYPHSGRMGSRFTLAGVRTIEGRTRKECLIEPSGSPDSGEGCAVGRAEPSRRSQRAGNATHGGTSPIPSMFDADDFLDWGKAA